MAEEPVYCVGRDALSQGFEMDGPAGTESTAVGPDGAPVCAEFACRTWGCWCPRADALLQCEHGNHPRDCDRCPPDQPFPEG